MCKLSSHLKLCTCKTKDVTKLKNYWILHRVVKGKNEMIIGEPMIPYFLDPEKDLYNKELLLKLLNDQSAFDAGIQPKENDYLELNFDINGAYPLLNYSFVYKRHRWKETEYGGVTWMWHHDEYAAGKIVNALA
jgi:hypothetical protein